MMMVRQIIYVYKVAFPFLHIKQRGIRKTVYKKTTTAATYEDFTERGMLLFINKLLLKYINYKKGQLNESIYYLNHVPQVLLNFFLSSV